MSAKNLIVQNFFKNLNKEFNMLLFHMNKQVKSLFDVIVKHGIVMFMTFNITIFATIVILKIFSLQWLPITQLVIFVDFVVH